jgi:hypothetical protein
MEKIVDRYKQNSGLFEIIFKQYLPQRFVVALTET